MIDYDAICQSHDLVAMVEQSTPLHRAGAEWRGACPIHNGQDTTAFAVYTDRGKQRWKCFSHDCGQGDVVDYIMAYHRVDKPRALEMLGGKQITTAEAVKAQADRLEREAQAALAEAEKRLAAIAELQRQANWLMYQEKLQGNQSAREAWRSRGIPDDWQDWFKLGYCPSFAAMTEGGKITTPTLAIPVWGPGWELQNIRHRLLHPFKPTDKYRPERAGLPATPYMCDPDIGWDAERYLVVEGEIKAMVTYLTADTPGLQVLGIPGKLAFRNIIDRLKGKDVVISLDPGADEDAREFARQVAGRMFTTPLKIDDAIIDGMIGKSTILSLMRTARKYA